MRTLGILTIAVGLLGVSVAACSAAPAPEGSIVDDAPVNKKKSAPAEDDNSNENVTPTPTPAPTPVPVDTTRDGIKNGDETDIDCGGPEGCRLQRRARLHLEQRLQEQQLQGPRLQGPRGRDALLRGPRRLLQQPLEHGREDRLPRHPVRRQGNRLPG